MVEESANQEEIEVLHARIKKYEEMLQETLNEKRSISKITAGPFEFEGAKFYRAGHGESAAMLYMWEESPFGLDMTGVLEIGTEIISVGQAIISVIPEELTIKKEPLDFTLVDWTEIGGLSSQIDEIKEAVELPIKNAKLAAEIGIDEMKGLLLFGAPGCGKTLVAKAIASTILTSKTVDPDAFVYVKGAEILSRYVGEAEERIARIFKRSREYAKKSGQRGVIFIDEAEAILPARGSRHSSDVDQTVVPTFLSEMDGFDNHSPMMILATNLPKNIDSAILREGRIDLKIEIKRPTEADALEIFEIHLSKVKCADKILDLKEFGSKAVFSCDMKKNISGAMIATVVNTAGRKAMTRYIGNSKSKKGITKEDLQEAIKSINTSYAAGV